jgi:hypothetical protein
MSATPTPPPVSDEIDAAIPEKARLLRHLQHKGFNVPDFIYVSAQDFQTERFGALTTFLQRHQESFKVIARSAHPVEDHFKGGTFDSFETYADLGGIRYARKRMIKMAKTTKWLSIQRQCKFNGAPEVDADQMGVVVMPFINGSSVMAKKLWDDWEFGYSRSRQHKVQREPYVTRTPHDRKLLFLSEKIQEELGYPCEIEYVISEEGEIFVVQAKDISNIDILHKKDSERSVRLAGVRRVRVRRNYRERVVYAMNTRAFLLEVISQCEDLLTLDKEREKAFRGILAHIAAYEKSQEAFALRHQRFAILGFSIQAPEELFQIANHYLDDEPEMQAPLSKALHNNLYWADTFIAEADTLISKDKLRINLCGHDAYGIDTVRNPIWNVFWPVNDHQRIMRQFQKIGFTTGDLVGIEIDNDAIPTVYRL